MCYVPYTDWRVRSRLCKLTGRFFIYWSYCCCLSWWWLMLRQSPRLLWLGSFRTLANWRWWWWRKMFKIHSYWLFLIIWFIIFNRQFLWKCMGFKIIIIVLCSFSLIIFILNWWYWLRRYANRRLLLFVGILSSATCSLLTLRTSRFICLEK